MQPRDYQFNHTGLLFGTARAFTAKALSLLDKSDTDRVKGWVGQGRPMRMQSQSQFDARLQNLSPITCVKNGSGYESHFGFLVAATFDAISLLLHSIFVEART